MQRGWEKGIKSLNSMESKKGGEEEQRMHSTGHTSLPRSAGGRWPRLIFFGFAHDLMFWARKWSDRPHILMSSHLTPDYAEMTKENRHWSVEAQPLEQDCSKVQAGSPSPGYQPPTEVRFWFIPRPASAAETRAWLMWLCYQEANTQVHPSHLFTSYPPKPRASRQHSYAPWDDRGPSRARFLLLFRPGKGYGNISKGRESGAPHVILCGVCGTGGNLLSLQGRQGCV